MGKGLFLLFPTVTRSRATACSACDRDGLKLAVAVRSLLAFIHTFSVCILPSFMEKSRAVHTNVINEKSSSTLKTYRDTLRRDR